MKYWTKDEVENELNNRGWFLNKREILHGIQFTLTDDTPIDWYEKSGRVVVKGKDTKLRNEASLLFGESSPETATPVQTSKIPTENKRVFVVYGHDEMARNELELILRRLKLEPIILQNLPPDGDTIIEKLEKNATKSDYAFVLITPDDEGCKKDCHTEMKPRARQNVVLELGMMLTKLGRKRVAILIKDTNIEKPSDINGLIYINFKAHVDEINPRIGACLEQAGFKVSLSDLIS